MAIVATTENWRSELTAICRAADEVGVDRGGAPVPDRHLGGEPDPAHRVGDTAHRLVEQHREQAAVHETGWALVVDTEANA